jgi:hypothetical protein
LEKYSFGCGKKATFIIKITVQVGAENFLPLLFQKSMMNLFFLINIFRRIRVATRHALLLHYNAIINSAYFHNQLQTNYLRHAARGIAADAPKRATPAKGL